jgi:hypothetical protein
MRRLIALAVSSAALAAVSLLQAPTAAAQRETCTTVSVASVAHRQVELFDDHGTLVTTVARDELGAVTSARDCPSTPSLLAIRVQGQRFYVRRAALRLQVADLNRPVCAAGQFASRSVRDASSSGAGGASCRQPDQQ